MPQAPDSSALSPAPPDHDRNTVERAVEIAIRISLLALWVALCFAIMQPFLVPIAWGIIITIAVHPGYLALLRRVGHRRVLASTLFILIALLVLILPIYLLSETLVQGAESLAHGYEGGRWTIPPAPDLSYIPLIGSDIQDLWHTASLNIEEALGQIEPQLRQAGQWVLGFARDAGLGILHFIIAIFIAGVMLAKSEVAGNVAHGIAHRLAGHHGSRFAELAIAVVRSVSRGILGWHSFRPPWPASACWPPAYPPRASGHWSPSCSALSNWASFRSCCRRPSTSSTPPAPPRRSSS